VGGGRFWTASEKRSWLHSRRASGTGVARANAAFAWTAGTGVALLGLERLVARRPGVAAARRSALGVVSGVGWGWLSVAVGAGGHTAAGAVTRIHPRHVAASSESTMLGS
jgi:hypothetical protein